MEYIPTVKKEDVSKNDKKLEQFLKSENFEIILPEDFISFIKKLFSFINKIMPEIFSNEGSIYSILFLSAFRFIFSSLISELTDENIEKFGIFLILYVYVDHFIDNPNIKKEDKHDFIIYIQKRFSGIIDNKYVKFNRIMELFEKYFNIESKAYEWLFYAYEIEKKSNVMQKSDKNISNHEKLCLEKGISTLMLMLYMGNEDPEPWVCHLFSTNLAFIGQMTDDLIDLKNDIKENRYTMCTLTVKKKIRIDSCLEKLFDSFTLVESILHENRSDLEEKMSKLKNFHVIFLGKLNEEYCSYKLKKIVNERFLFSYKNLRKKIKEIRSKLKIKNKIKNLFETET